MRVATIDIGTNTVLLLVAEKRGDDLVAIEEHALITRLGQGVDETRTLAPEAIARTNEALARYAEVVERTRAERVAVVGTSAMRDAGGGEAVRAHVKARFGVEARTISGDEEARLTFAGALSGVRTTSDDVVVFDIGGGSTEVVFGNRTTRAIAWARSFDVGSVRLTERHVRHDPPAKDELEATLAAARAAFASVPVERSTNAAPPVGIAGTMTTIAAVSLGMEPYDGARVHGMTLETREVARVVYEEFAARPVAERARLRGLDPKRADVIVAGGLLGLALLQHLGAERVTISDRGVRWGLAEELAR
jgi:exopolyphosphatase/guanosine-5'-triphosphate,3'-diphosphate pyrophosphatase